MLLNSQGAKPCIGIQELWNSLTGKHFKNKSVKILVDL